MKIAINTCYGGFGVSSDALKELIKRGSKAVESTAVQEYYGASDPTSHLYRENWKKIYAADLAACNDAGDGYVTDRFGSTLYKNDVAYNLNRNEEFRTDADLIAVIEEMGSEKASSRLAKLKVVEVPDGIKWSLSEYDGTETIEEEHRPWS